MTKKNQKLTDSQILTISYLRSKKVPTIIIARALQILQGVALSTTYYHVNKIEIDERIKKKAEIVKLIKLGYNTKVIAEMWNEELEMVNKIYSK